MVVRCRRIQGKGADSVVKLRPVVPNDMPAELRALDTFGIEVDAMPTGFVCSASYKGVSDPDKTKLASFGHGPIHKVFNKDQRVFYKAHAPEGLELDDLTVLGPSLRREGAVHAGGRTRPQARRRAMALP